MYFPALFSCYCERKHERFYITNVAYAPVPMDQRKEFYANINYVIHVNLSSDELRRLLFGRDAF